MISHFLACLLWASAPRPIPQGVLPEIATGRTTTHLKQFFDARSLGSGDAVFLAGSAFDPKYYAPLPQPKQKVAIARAQVSKPSVKHALLRPVVAGVSATAPIRRKSEARKPPAPKNIEDVNVSLNVNNAKLYVLLTLLMDQANVNLVLLTSTDQPITVRMVNVKLIDMLHTLCAATGLDMLKVGNAFVFASSDKLKTSYSKEWLEAHPVQEPPAPAPDDPVVTRIYKTNYVDAELLITQLGKMFKETSVSFASAPAPIQPTLSAQDPGSKTGATASVLTNTGESAKFSRIIMLRGPSKIVNDILAAAQQFDIPRQQVNISVTIHDISDEGLKELGIEWTLPQTTISESANNGLQFGRFGRSPISFQATLKGLETRDKAKLLASPNISVLDNVNADILVGNRLTFPVLIGYSQQGSPIYDKQEERVGIYLQVKPWITNDGQVELRLYPQVSTVTGFINVNGASYPQISTREADTVLRVKSGQTIVLGGMLKNEDITSLQSVPILSKIPLIGELFTRRRHTRSSSQVMMTITPTILPN